MKQFIFTLVFIIILAADYVAVFGQQYMEDDPEFLQQQLEQQREEQIRAEQYLNAFADVRLLSGLVWAEAGNQPIEGQLAVAIVVCNRIRNPQFEDSVFDVITEPHQFGPASNGSWEKGLEMYDNGTIPFSCVYVALQALSGTTDIVWNEQFIDFSQIHYFNTSMNNSRYQIAAHKFK